MTNVILFGAGGELKIKESYQTIKKRLFSVGDFIEVTAMGQKLLLSKRDVIRVAVDLKPDAVSKSHSKEVKK